MLSHARQKHIYDLLCRADLCDPPAEIRARRYDLITAADVLIYIGDLAPAFSLVRSLMAAGGRFAFSVEAGAGGTGYSLWPTLRYSHAPDYIQAELSVAGMRVLDSRQTVLRQDRGADVHGILYVCGSD